MGGGAFQRSKRDPLRDLGQISKKATHSSQARPSMAFVGFGSSQIIFHGYYDPGPLNIENRHPAALKRIAKIKVCSGRKIRIQCSRP